MKMIMDDLFNVRISFKAMPAAEGNRAEVMVKEIPATSSEDNVRIVEPEVAKEESDTAEVSKEEEGAITDSDAGTSDMGIIVPEGDFSGTEDGLVDSGLILDTGEVNLDMGGEFQGGMDMTNTGTTTAVKDPLLSNWGFVIGVTSGVLALSIVFGILLAKKRIKKGIDLYED